MTFASVSASEITKIFITHFHGDHCLGLPGVLQRLSLDRISHAVEVYYPASGQKFFNNLKNASVYTNTAEIIEKPISSEGVIFRDKNLIVETRRLEHSTESWGYRFREPDSVTMLPEKLKEFGVAGRDIGKLKEMGAIEINGKIVRREEASVFKKGQSFAFVMDTGVCQSAYDLAREADFLIIESTFLSSESKEAFDYRHLTAQQAAEIAREANAKQLVLTHFSQRYTNIEDFAREARAVFPDSIAVADGREIEFRREKVL